MVQMDPQLQFSSVDALHRSGNPNNDMQRTFQSIRWVPRNWRSLFLACCSLKLAIDKVEKILAAARTEPNLERKYSLFYRAACLCNLLVKRRDFDSSYLVRRCQFLVIFIEAATVQRLRTVTERGGSSALSAGAALQERQAHSNIPCAFAARGRAA